MFLFHRDEDGSIWANCVGLTTQFVAKIPRRYAKQVRLSLDKLLMSGTAFELEDAKGYVVAGAVREAEGTPKGLAVVVSHAPGAVRWEAVLAEAVARKIVKDLQAALSLDAPVTVSQPKPDDEPEEFRDVRVPDPLIEEWPRKMRFRFHDEGDCRGHFDMDFEQTRKLLLSQKPTADVDPPESEEVMTNPRFESSDEGLRAFVVDKTRGGSEFQVTFLLPADRLDDIYATLQKTLQKVDSGVVRFHMTKR